MPNRAFSESDIRQYAFPAVAKAGRECFDQNQVRNLHAVGDDIIATVVGDESYRVVIRTPAAGSPTFACTCEFAYGGACEHAVAVMLAVGMQDSLQTGLDLTVAESATPARERERERERDSRQSRPTPAGKDEKAQIRDAEGEARAGAPVQVIVSKPAGRLYLHECDGMLLADVRFGYADGYVEFSRRDSSRDRVVPGDDGAVYRVLRSRAREDNLTNSLRQHGLMQYQTGTYTPQGDAREWVCSHLPRLAAKGWEIFGQERLAKSSPRQGAPRLSVCVGEKGEFLECGLTVSVDGIPATLAALVQAVREGSKYVLLSDGSTGMIPEQLLTRLASLFALAEYDEQDTLRFQRCHLAAAEMLSEIADEAQWEEQLEERRKAFSRFAGIERRPVPSDFQACMRPYQLAGYEWFYFLRESGFGGCLADDMGLGKTIQALALLLSEKRQKRRHATSLVVVPASLLFNWQREARTFAPALITMIYHGPERRKFSASELYMADVLISTYATVLRDQSFLEKMRFNYVICDEAQAIKTPNARIGKAIRRLNADHRLALSGTPIENNLSELWSIFSFLNPGMFGSFRRFSETFVRPIEREQRDDVAEALRRTVFPFILRRTKQQVATDLPPKTETVLYADMLPRQQTLYEITRDTYRGKILESIDRGEIDRSGFQILEGLLRLRQICCHPALMDSGFSGESAKFQLLDTMLEDVLAEGHRALVFSQFVQALQLFRSRLIQKKIRSEILTGQTRDRGAVVDRFQKNKDISVFLISLKAGGTGLNLTSADYVIHLDPWWNPAAENQASDRAYRIGQTRHVFVYKMIMRNTIEERVLALQQGKKELADQIIRTEKSFFKTLTRDQVRGLFV
jgi:non-specific serine/threonine protein kinase